MNATPIVIEKVFTSDFKTVWNALTERDLMKQWYFNLPEFKAVVGFKFEIKGGPSPEKQYLHLCEILEVIPYHKLKHSWRYDGFEGISFLTFELFPLDNHTKLKVTHEGLESFPADQPDFAHENFDAGWNQIIGTSLKEFLDKK